MKRSCYLFLFMLISVSSFAQKIWLTPFGGYTFDDRVNLNNGQAAKVIGGAHYGASLEFNPNEYVGIELLYQRQDTKGYYDAYINNSSNRYNADLAVQYIMLGVLHHRPFNEKLEGYGGLNLGMGLADNKSNGENYTKFAWGLKAGLGIKATPKVIIRLQAQLMSMVQGAGGGLYVGTGGGGAGVSTYSSILQFGFTGGLCFGLGH
jgi:hypothetical protein